MQYNHQHRPVTTSSVLAPEADSELQEGWGVAVGKNSPLPLDFLSNDKNDHNDNIQAWNNLKNICSVLCCHTYMNSLHAVITSRA